MNKVYCIYCDYFKKDCYITLSKCSCPNLQKENFITPNKREFPFCDLANQCGECAYYKPRQPSSWSKLWDKVSSILPRSGK